jgi:hypothetical protein
MPLRLTAITKQNTVTVGKNDPRADYNTANYDNDALAIQAGINAGTNFVILKGDFEVGTNIYISRSNVDIKLVGSITLLNTLYTAFPSHMEGLFHVRNIAGLQENVTITGGKIDLDNHANTPAITAWGGGNDNSMLGLDKLSIIDVAIENFNGGIAYAPITLVSAREGIPHGFISNIEIKGCNIINSNLDGVTILGDYVENFVLENNSLDTIDRNPFQFYAYKERTLRNFNITNNTFTNTKNIPYTTGAQNIKADIHDGNRMGIQDLFISNNRFIGDDTYRQETVSINIHGGSVAKITDNYFYKQWSCVSIGESFAGSRTINPSNLVNINNNTFEKTHFCEFDHDSATNAKIHHNTFIDTGVLAYTAYSSNAREAFTNNTIINANSKIEDASLQTALDATTHAGSLDLTDEPFKSAIRVGSCDDMILKDNIIIDNRLIPNPYLHPLVLGSVVGGSLGSRTRWVGIAYTTATGETKISKATSISVPANDLLTVSIGEFPSHVDNYVSAIKTIKIYVGDTENNLRQQFEFDFHLESFKYMVTGNVWTEPVGGVNLSNALAPTTNTTRTLTKYGIYNLDTSRTSHPNLYAQNIVDGTHKLFGGNDLFINEQNRFKQIVKGQGSVDEFSSKAVCSFNVGRELETYYRIDLEGKITFSGLSVNKVFAFTKCDVYICIASTTGTFDETKWELYTGPLPDTLLTYSSGTSYVVGNIIKANESVTNEIEISVIETLPAGYALNDYFPIVKTGKINLEQGHYILKQMTHNNEYLGVPIVLTLT